MIKDYKAILIAIQEINNELRDTKELMETLMSIRSQRISDMPKGQGYDNISQLADLIDKEKELLAQRKFLLIQAKSIRKELGATSKVRTLELYYLGNKSFKEIALMLDKSYWAVSKTISRC